MNQKEFIDGWSNVITSDKRNSKNDWINSAENDLKKAVVEYKSTSSDIAKHNSNDQLVKKYTALENICDYASYLLQRINFNKR